MVNTRRVTYSAIPVRAEKNRTARIESTSKSIVKAKAMDARLSARPSTSSCSTLSDIQMRLKKHTPQEPMMTEEYLKNVEKPDKGIAVRANVHTEQKLDIIMGTLTNLQESVRELHNEFSALKPRISSFQTSTTCQGMIVKQHSMNTLSDDYKKLLAKRKKSGNH